VVRDLEEASDRTGHSVHLLCCSACSNPCGHLQQLAACCVHRPGQRQPLGGLDVRAGGRVRQPLTAHFTEPVWVVVSACQSVAAVW
jgi:hypothetical protein